MAITEDEYNRWLPPEAARRLLAERGVSYDTANVAILTRITNGDLRVVAERAVTHNGSQTVETAFAEIVPSAWERTAVDSVFWMTGDATFRRNSGRYGEADRVTVATGVRFDPAGVQKMLAQLPPEPRRPAQRIDHFARGAAFAPDLVALPTGERVPRELVDAHAAAPDGLKPDFGEEIGRLRAQVEELKGQLAKRPSPRHAGGAPPKPWWDDLWVEMFRQIWEGELKLTAQARIEEAMMQWASDNGHDMSEVTAKRAARKLWAVAKPKGS